MKVNLVQALQHSLDAQAALGSSIEVTQLSWASPCPGWTVRKVLNHSIGVTLKFAQFADGTDRPRTPSGDLVGLDHIGALRATADTAHGAWVSVDMDRRCELSFGSFAADAAAGINLFDVLAHTWDLATAIGLEFDCADELWASGLHAAKLVIGDPRDLNHYAPEIPVPPEISLRAQFLGFLGRRERSARL